MTYAALFFGTLLGCLIGRQYGFMEARRLADTLKRWNAAQEATEIHMLQGSNFDYLCEWPVEDTRLDWTEEWMARMGRG